MVVEELLRSFDRTKLISAFSVSLWCAFLLKEAVFLGTLLSNEVSFFLYS